MEAQRRIGRAKIAHVVSERCGRVAVLHEMARRSRECKAIHQASDIRKEVHSIAGFCRKLEHNLARPEFRSNDVNGKAGD